MIIDKLIEKIRATDCPVCVGLDTDVSYLPKVYDDKAAAVLGYNAELIDRLKGVIPAVKVQVAYYEALGVAGMQAFADTLALSRKAGLVAIADCKRNDIGSTAATYSSA